MADGTSTSRMVVASRAITTASTNPILLQCGSLSSEEPSEEGDHDRCRQGDRTSCFLVGRIGGGGSAPTGGRPGLRGVATALGQERGRETNSRLRGGSEPGH